MKNLLILLIFLYSTLIAVAQSPSDCSDDPFASGCTGTNQSVSQTAILCADGTIFHSDGSGYNSNGVAIANTGKGTNFTSATSMNRACDNNGGVSAYVDDGVLQTSAVVTTAQNGISTNINSNSQSSGGIDVNVSNLSTSTTFVSPSNIDANILSNLPDWSGTTAFVWVPFEGGDPTGVGMTSSGTTSSGTTSSGTTSSGSNENPNYWKGSGDPEGSCCSCSQCLVTCPVSNPTIGGAGDSWFDWSATNCGG